MIKRNNIPMDVIANRVARAYTDLDAAIEQCEKDMYNYRDLLHRRVLDDSYETVTYSRRRCMDGLRQLIEWLKELKQRRQSDVWHPITRRPPYGKDLMLKVHDRRCSLDTFNYYVMGFYDGEKYFTYNFSWWEDKDLEIVGWRLCPWEAGEQE